MPLVAGARLGPYEIVGRLGGGGMGEVYRARDTKLNRDVAIKVLPDAVGADPERRARLHREAQLLAALNHPNIAAIYGFEDSTSTHALAMELVDGRTLADLIAQGPIPLADSMSIASQVAAALDAAHEQGIVHRDLKPDNITVRVDGTVKVLDFGLAKAMDATGTGSPTLSMSPTVVPSALTQIGVVLGTAAYMSPEQARGHAVDKRTDIWAFGCVLFEMLTGRPAFSGVTLADIMAAVVLRSPDWSLLPAATPAGVRTLIRGCLEKDPRDRLRDIGDMHFVTAGQPERIQRSTVSRRLVAVWALVAVLATALAVSSQIFRPSAAAPDRPLIRLNVDLGPEAIHQAVLEPRISPDGTRLIFLARSPDGKSELAVRSLDRPELAFLPGTENASQPFFSPDGTWVGFFDEGTLKKVAVQGGPVVTIANSAFAQAPTELGVTWSDDHSIVFTPGTVQPFSRVSADGGELERFLKLGGREEATLRWPYALPGGRNVLLTSHKIIMGFDDATIESGSIATGERKTILKGGYFARYIAAGPRSGYLLFVREGTLFAAAFDPETSTVRSSPTPLLDDVASDSDTAAGQFDLSKTGTLIYRSGPGPARSWPILWMDSTGRTEPLLADAGAYYTIRLSPDGARIAMTINRGDRGREIAVFDPHRRVLSQLTFTRGVNLFPVWSPDGKYIAFESSSPSGYGIGLVRVDGSGALQRIGNSPGLMIPASFSPDGKYLAYSAPGGCWVAPFDARDDNHPKLGSPQAFASGDVGGGSPMFSPDGRWIAYSSTLTGRAEAYVRPFPGPGPRWQISTDGLGGGGLAWAPDGGRVYYRARDGRLMVTEFNVFGGSATAGKPRRWSDAPIGATAFPRDFSVAPDGRRVAIFPPRRAVVEQGTVHATVVLNFLDELRRRVK